MPIMDGLAATQGMRAVEAARPGGRRTPIVVVSASAMINEVDHCLAAGADAHLAKPFRRAQLDEVIRRVIGAAGGVS
jgi:CheY-like chemotaxis protein